MVSSVIQGDYLLNFAESQTAEEVLKRSLKEHQIKGFSSVLISKNVEEGLCSLIQTSGLGKLICELVYVIFKAAYDTIQ